MHNKAVEWLEKGYFNDHIEHSAKRLRYMISLDYYVNSMSQVLYYLYFNDEETVAQRK